MSFIKTNNRESCQFFIIAPGGMPIKFHVDRVFDHEYKVWKIDSDGQLNRIGTICSSITEAQHTVASYMGRCYMNVIVEGTLELMDLPPID